MKTIFYASILFSIFLSCQNKTNSPYHNDPIPEHQTISIASDLLGEKRIINIWTPPNYKNSNKHYPVLYMPDGGVQEDFPHIANTLANLIEKKKIPPYLLVGIENTERGRDLTGYSEAEYDKQFCPLSDGAKHFRNFLTQELMPEINKNYKTTSKTGIIGESLAGLFVMETFFLYPNSFDVYIAMDPSLWWNNHFLAKHADSLLQSLPQTNKKLWFAGSSAKDISIYTKSVEKSLKEHAPKQLRWQYENEPQEEHHTIYRATKEKALVWSLN